MQALTIINKNKEAYKLSDHINKTVRNGFSASVRPDSSILVSYSGYDVDFEMSLEFSVEYLCWMIDNNQYSVRGSVPSMSYSKGQIGFITMAMASYNVSLNKRLSK